MRHEDSDSWSGLRTVTSFDEGSQDTAPVGMPHREIHRFSPSSFLVETLVEQLCKLMEKDPKLQKQLYLTICGKLHQMNLINESYSLEEFQFMRSYYQKALLQFLTVAKATGLGVDSKAVYPTPSYQVGRKPEQVLEWSRYATEFQELEFIARGGFGQVYKAKHKLDCGHYAVKKICLRYNNVSSFLESLHEVKMLARLNHPNIVAYKAAWLEPLDSSHQHSSVVINTRIEESEESSHEIVFESEEGAKKEESGEGVRTGVVCQYNFKDTHCFNSITQDWKDWAMLYIQMQLCEVTLREWLDGRNRATGPPRADQAINIFRQILSGVHYIHSQGIVHHDIKPSNVFVSRDLSMVQVGDFGLSCCLISHSTSPSVSFIPPPAPVVPPVDHRKVLGTKLYAAPEQLRGICHPKSDVYSLGIILLELMLPFQTDMERSKVIARLKAGHIPAELTATYPKLARLISQTISASVERRPSASELLTSLDGISFLEDSDCENWPKLLAERDQTIKQLRRDLELRQQEIIRLRKQLEAFNLKEM